MPCYEFLHGPLATSLGDLPNTEDLSLRRCTCINFVSSTGPTEDSEEPLIRPGRDGKNGIYRRLLLSCAFTHISTCSLHNNPVMLAMLVSPYR